MTLNEWITLGVLAGVMASLALTRWAADAVLVVGLLVLMICGIVSPTMGLSGFSNPGMITVGVLFIVAGGLQATGAMAWVTRSWLSGAKGVKSSLLRIMPPVVVCSAFFNNTPLVAIMTPIALDLARKSRFSPSHLLMPISYAAILGGVCTLIGTSTNLVVAGLVITEGESRADMEPLELFSITWLGLPIAVVGLIYIYLFSKKLLPERKPAFSMTDDPREYTTELVVVPDGPLVGRTIEEAGLRHLPQLYLAEIDRDGRVMAAVSPEEKLRSGDRLVFVGVVDSVKDLRDIRGLIPADGQAFKLNAPQSERCLVEAVVSDSHPLLGQTVRTGRFRTVYDAVIIAVARNGERIQRKIGDIELAAGDTLLLETDTDFLARHQNNRDFYLVREVSDWRPPRHDRAWISLLILLGIVISVTSGMLDMLLAAMIGAALIVITRCLSMAEARRHIDWSVLIVIAAAIGIGQAVMASGLAASAAEGLFLLGGSNPWVALILVYLLTVILTEMITNNAAAVLVFPIALATADKLDASPMPFIMVIMIAASASFITPIGYQTNLMVYGPGGYRFTDYARLGLPLAIIVAIMAIGLAPLIWSF